MFIKKEYLRYIVAVFFSLILAVIFFPFQQERVYIANYCVDVASLLIIAVMLLRYIRKKGFNLFDPLLLITFIFSFMFFITPIYDIVIEQHTWFGYDMFQYGVKSSIIAICGYTVFYILYCFGCRNSDTIETVNTYVNTEQENEKTRVYIPAILVMYVICFAANLYYLIHSGYANILYILTLGFFGKGHVSGDVVESIGFVAMFSYSLPTLVMLYWHYSKKKYTTLFLFVPMFMMQLTRGFRFLIVQIAISFTAYYFISKKRKPRLTYIAIAAAILMIPVLIVTVYRNDVRSGAGITGLSLSFETINKAVDDAVWDNFRIYNNYYGLVNAVPKTYDYIFGRQMIIGTLAMAIPRAIWPNKIVTKAGEDLSAIVGSHLARTGQAYPGIGEYYYSFGIIGVLFFMALYGLWMGVVKKKYLKDNCKGYDIVMFSVILGTNLQFLIRGYTPSNFWYLIFSLLPVFIIMLIGKINAKRVNKIG